MKALLIVAVCLPCFTIAQVLKVKAYSSLAAHYDKGTFVSGKTLKVNFLVVIDFDNDKIKLYGEGEGDFDIVKHDSSWIINDIAYSRYTAIDARGKNCEITVVSYSEAQRKSAQQEGAIGTVSIRYGEELLILYLKKDD